MVKFLDDPKDTRFFVAVEGNIGLVDQARNEIAYVDYQNSNIYESMESITIFRGGDTIYARGLSEEPAKIVIYAYGSNDGAKYLTNLVIDCQTYIAAQDIEVVTTTVYDEEDNEVINAEENIIFVEVGKSIVLTNDEEFGYFTDGGSARNLQFAVQGISSNLAKNIEVTYQNIASDNPQITITGKIANTKNQYIYAYLELPNFVKSQVFKIFVWH